MPWRRLSSLQRRDSSRRAFERQIECRDESRHGRQRVRATKHNYQARELKPVLRQFLNRKSLALNIRETRACFLAVLPEYIFKQRWDVFFAALEENQYRWTCAA